MRIAVVGAGIAGLSAARMLQRDGHRVTLYEASGRLGGHTHTVDVTLEGVTAPVDTGFLVFNDRTYPRLVQLFDELGVDSIASEMSFSVRSDAEGLEWAGTNLLTVFAQKRNLARPAFWRMLADLVRFNRDTTRMVAGGSIYSVTLGEYLEAEGFGAEFRDWYLLPMAAAIWSSPRSEILGFPLPTFVRFCHNHGLLSLADRPQWRTVRGGGREYVARIAHQLADVRLASPVRAVRRKPRHVEVETAAHGVERFDQVVLACHSDQSLALLADATATERRLLAKVRYQRNRVVLHTDAALMPRRREAWSAWNYLSAVDPGGSRPVAVTYWINRLQSLPFRTPVLVTLNPPFEPAPDSVLGEYDYSHPVLDSQAVSAQRAFARIQGERRTWFAGAWMGYGFHEDGVASAVAVVDGIRDGTLAAVPAAATALRPSAVEPALEREAA